VVIQRLKILNFKRFRTLDIEFKAGMNILVGGNNAGKSTVLEAIHLATTGLLSGRYLKNELSQHLFNNETVAEYIASLTTASPLAPPQILIEVFLSELAEFEGNGNTTKEPATGFYLSIEFDEVYRHEYQKLIETADLRSLPIEYYTASWSSFARYGLTPRTVPFKSVLIDSTAVRYQSGSDVYVSRIVRDFLDTPDVIGIAQAYRRMKEAFSRDAAIASVNSKIQKSAHPLMKAVTLSADLPSKNDWEDSLVACVEDVPLNYIGKGEQSILKTRLALQHKASQNAAVILLEEPENHLTHANLNNLLRHIKESNPDKQIIVTTHSSFVANKLGLGTLVLLNDARNVRLSSLTPNTKEFFEKIAGYDTLRLILATRVILVEGASDELIVQKAYSLHHGGKMPIEDGIDVISVGTSFLRFLEIADHIQKPVAVVTDNDGNPEGLKNKYADYLGGNTKTHIKICFDPKDEVGPQIGGKPFNYNTLEPSLLRANGLEVMNRILGTNLAEPELQVHMRANKTDCALKVFKTQEAVQFPGYLIEAIS